MKGTDITKTDNNSWIRWNRKSRNLNKLRYKRDQPLKLKSNI